MGLCMYENVVRVDTPLMMKHTGKVLLMVYKLNSLIFFWIYM